MTGAVQDRLRGNLHLVVRGGVVAGVSVWREMREIWRRNFQPEAVSWVDDGSRVAEIDLVFVRRSRLNERRRRFRASTEPRSDDAIEKILREAVGMHVDELGREVRVHRRRPGPEPDLHLPQNGQRLREWRARVDEHIVAALDLGLVLHARAEVRAERHAAETAP